MFLQQISSLCQLFKKLKDFGSISAKLLRTQFSIDLVNNLKIKTNLYLENIERKEMVISENLENEDFTKKIKKNNQYQNEHSKINLNNVEENSDY